MMKKLSAFFLAITLISFSAYSTPPCIPSFTTDIAHGDTICVGIAVSFTNTSDLGGESLTFKQWNFGDGSNPVNVENPTHIFTQSGTFTVTFNLASASCTGIMAQQIITVIDPPGLQTGSQQPSCFGFCDGEAQVFITSGSHTNYLIEWDDPATQNTDIATNLCDGVYFATVSDIYGCIATGPSVTVTEPDELIVEAGSDVFICEGSQWPLSEADIVSGGVGDITYMWEPGLALSDPTQLNPILDVNDPGDFGVYVLTAIDENGCSGSDDLQVQQTPGEIHGTIFDDTGLSPQGNILVSLIKRGNDDTEWEIYDTYTTLGDGMYHFINLPLVDYIVKAETASTPPEQMMPTYWHNTDTVFDWEEAEIISVECGIGYFQTDINMMRIPGSMGGDCDFKGKVYLVSIGKTQTEDPIPFIDVVVKKTPPGNAVAYTQTDDGTGTIGQFWFQGIAASPDSTYSFVVNIPGLGMQENHLIEVAFDDSLYNNLNFYVDTTPGTGGIFTYNPLGVEALKYKPNQMLAFPNPFAEECELRFTNTENTNFGFTLFDITGKVILRDEQLHGNSYLMNTENLEQGIYIAEVKTEQAVYRTRVMKK